MANFLQNLICVYSRKMISYHINIFQDVQSFLYVQYKIGNYKSSSMFGIIGDAKLQQLDINFKFEKTSQKLIIYARIHNLTYRSQIGIDKALDFDEVQQQLLQKKYKVVLKTPETLKIKLGPFPLEFKIQLNLTVEDLNKIIFDLTNKFNTQIQKNIYFEKLTQKLRIDIDSIKNKSLSNQQSPQKKDKFHQEISSLKNLIQKIESKHTILEQLITQQKDQIKAQKAQTNFQKVGLTSQKIEISQLTKQMKEINKKINNFQVKISQASNKMYQCKEKNKEIGFQTKMNELQIKLNQQSQKVLKLVNQTQKQKNKILEYLKVSDFNTFKEKIVNQQLKMIKKQISCVNHTTTIMSEKFIKKELDIEEIQKKINKVKQTNQSMQVDLDNQKTKFTILQISFSDEKQKTTSLMKMISQKIKTLEKKLNIQKIEVQPNNIPIVTNPFQFIIQPQQKIYNQNHLVQPEKPKQMQPKYPQIQPNPIIVCKLYNLQTNQFIQAQLRKGSRIITCTEEQTNLLLFFNHKNNHKKIKYLNLLYRATENQFSIEKFHQQCDGIPNTLVLVETQFKKKIGGFTPLVWESASGKFRSDQNCESFLFSLSHNEYFYLRDHKKAIQVDNNSGPVFGQGRDLKISDKANINDNSHANIQHSYQNLNEDKSQDYVNRKFGGNLKGSSHFKVLEWQVWKVQF